jgi:hypothetical protein
VDAFRRSRLTLTDLGQSPCSEIDSGTTKFPLISVDTILTAAPRPWNQHPTFSFRIATQESRAL